MAAGAGSAPGPGPGPAPPAAPPAPPAPTAAPGPAPGPAAPGRTVLVRGLPATATAAHLEGPFGRLGPLRRCFVVTEKGTKTCRGFGYVTFSLAEDARRALREPPTLGGRRLTVTPARQRPRDGCKNPEKATAATAATGAAAAGASGAKKPRAASRKARLIVRNLSFKCSEAELKSLFSPFGAVLEVNVPKKADGRLRGFAFVQLRNLREAARALRALNMKEIKGRPVAVDWAVAKDRYRATQGGRPHERTEEEGGRERGGGEEEEGSGEETEEDEGNEEEMEEDEDEEVKKGRRKRKNKAEEDEDEAEDDEDADEEEESEDEEEADEEEEEEEEEDEDQKVAGKRKGTKASGPRARGRFGKGAAAAESSEEEEEEEEEEDEEEDEDEEDDEEEEGGAAPQKRRGRGRGQPPSDVAEGRTLFIRNLSFDTEEEALAEALRPFGELSYVRIVLHPDTEHSKGCAFAQFGTQEAAQKCLQAAQEESEGGGLRLEGRLLRVDPAVSREEARRLRGRGAERPGGTRNLYLAREGLIRPGTKAAEGVSDADMAKRARFEERKRQRLRHPWVLVSRTRLCLHNLPRRLDSPGLRRLLLRLSPAARITECRVMREQRGQGRSLGYAFVEFGEHGQALAALRSLNNNPRLFGPHKRPIVEFSLEDQRKLRLKERRAQRSLLQLKPPAPKAAPAAGAPEPPPGPPGKRQGRKKPGPGPPRAPPGPPAVGQDPPPPAMGQDPPPAVGQDPPPAAVSWCGFRTAAQAGRARVPGGRSRRVLPLPSHRGPKLRKRDRGKAQPRPAKQPKGRSRRRRGRAQESPAQGGGRRGGRRGARPPPEEPQQRRERTPGSARPPPPRTRWFQS